MAWDVLIVGAALTGCCAAYHLLKRDPTLRVALVEKDPSFEFAASARSNAMIREIFSQPENLLMSQYGATFYDDFSALMNVNGSGPLLDYDRGGLLIIGNDQDQAAEICINRDFQIGMGCHVDLLSPADVSKKWPQINSDDIVNAVLSPSAGWIDPHGALMGLGRKVRAMGAENIAAEVVSFATDKLGNVISTRLADGGELTAKWVINATGAWAGKLCETAGVKIPVLPLPRMVYYFETQEPVEKLPYIRDGLGIGFRREGKGFISGITDFSVAGEFDFNVRHDWFEERVWPGLANRVPAFETIKVINSWVGHYAQNMFDGNMILGAWPGGDPHFLMATGDSGHGLQHAPAVGRALAETILDGGYQTLDLGRLGAQRIIDNIPYAERGWKA